MNEKQLLEYSLIVHASLLISNLLTDDDLRHTPPCQADLSVMLDCTLYITLKVALHGCTIDESSSLVCVIVVISA